MHKVLPFLFALVLTLPAAAHAATCPPDTIQLFDIGGTRAWQSFVSNDPALRLDRQFSFDSPPTSGIEMGRYDLAQGFLAANARGEASVNSVIVSTVVRVAASDTYVLTGPNDGNLVTFTARLRVHIACEGELWIDRGGMYPDLFPGGCGTASLSEPATGQRAEYTTCSNVDEMRDLELRLTRTVGLPFTLCLLVSAEGTPAPDNAADTAYPNAADVSGTLLFPDLPAGYGVASCQGYAGNVLVPVRTPTWGRIKTMHH